jgi:hypothetical protein
MRLFLIGALAATLVACGGSEAPSPPHPAGDTEDALATSAKLDEGLAFYEDGPLRGDFLMGMEVRDDGKVRILFDYPGSEPTPRVRDSCVSKATFEGAANHRTLKLVCPSDLSFEFGVVANDKKTLELENDKHERFALHKIPADFRGDTRLQCDSKDFKVTIDLSELSGDRRGALLRIEDKASASNRMTAPPGESLWLMGDAGDELTGFDFHRSPYDLTLPSEPSGHVEGELGYANVVSPFQVRREPHALSCDVEESR